MQLVKIVFSCIFLFTSLSLSAAAKAPASGSVPGNAVESASGLHYLTLQPAKPGAASIKPDFFEYKISIWIKNDAGKFQAKESGVLRSSFKSVAQSSPALARAALLSPVGETRRWWFSAADNSAQAQIFDLTVLGNVNPAPAPADVSAIPANASKTSSGLAYRVIKKGAGTGHPSLQSTITIDYSGWTPDGKLFDSSITRGEKAVFQLSGLISGWKEGLPLMSPGDTYRFWIPGYLAYDSIPNANGPKGMLVFDVTLHGFE